MGLEGYVVEFIGKDSCERKMGWELGVGLVGINRDIQKRLRFYSGLVSGRFIPSYAVGLGRILITRISFFDFETS